MTTPFQPQAPRSPDGYWWWDGGAWLPVPLDQVGAPAVPAASAAVPVQPTLLPADPVPVASSSRTQAFVGVGVLVLAVVAAAVVLVTTHDGSATTTAPRGSATSSSTPIAGATTADATTKSAAREAAVAEETYFTDYDAYTADVATLGSAGYRTEAGITLTLVLTGSATDPSFCLEAASRTHVATYASDRGGLQPSGARCASLPVYSPSPVDGGTATAAR